MLFFLKKKTKEIVCHRVGVGDLFFYFVGRENNNSATENPLSGQGFKSRNNSGIWKYRISAAMGKKLVAAVKKTVAAVKKLFAEIEKLIAAVENLVLAVKNSRSAQKNNRGMVEKLVAA